MNDTNVACNVPIEVLGKIFHLLCTEPISVAPKLRGPIIKFPWAVGRVSRHWRCAFISYPPIWTSISFFDLWIGQNDCEEVARRIAIYLERSGEFPLDIRLKIHMDACPQAWRLIRSFSHRWRTADIDIGTKRFMDDLFACKAKMPMLESLTVRGERFGRDRPAHDHESDHKVVVHDLHDDEEDCYDVFETAPSLNCLKLRCGSAIGRWILPWSQLIKLDVRMSTLFDVPALLQQLQNIEELLFTFEGIEARIIDNLGLFDGFSVRLEHMRVLQVPFPMILSWIEAPHLQEIRLGDPDEWFCEPQSHVEDLVSLIHRSGPSCRIRRLVLRGYDVSVAENIIFVLTEVEELHICTPAKYTIFRPTAYVYSILSKLVNGGDHPYLPALRQLTISLDPKRTLPKLVKRVSKILKLRWASTAVIVPLESLTIQLYEEFFFDTPPPLPMELVKAKLKWPSFVNIEFKYASRH
ncbi:hypothetical protein APHAL10511_003966 [Amanita phalloides]|nr:hypothetical protein APHAL10511_003966 [Amanita phalloides]